MESATPKINLIDPFSSEKWTRWAPRQEISPAFDRIKIGNEVQLMIGSKGHCNNYGKWYCELLEIQGDAEYDFSVEYHPENIDSEDVSIYAILTWKDREGELLRREYVDNISVLSDGWKGLQRTVRSPNDSYSLTAELAFRWAKDGVVIWRNPVLYKTDKSIVHRNVKVATTSIRTRHNTKDNLDAMRLYIDKAGQAGADIICITETFYGRFADISPYDISQTVPGDLTNAISVKAKEHGAYIIFSMYEKDDNDIYNTAVLIDRNGEIAGKYRKVHLPLSEVEAGVTPGNEYDIFDTDFGRIGIMICWDQAFPENARALTNKGAEIIFISTMGDEPLQQMARAKDNGVYVVVAGMYGPASSRIIDTYGQVIATAESQNKDEDEGICIAEIDLEKPNYTTWLSLGPCLSEPRSVYRKERRVDTYNF